MAKSDLSTILGLGIAGVAGWWLYNNWASIFGSVTTTTTTTPPAGGIVPSTSNALYPQTSAFLNSLPAAEANASFIQSVYAELTAAGMTDAQALALMQSKFAAYAACAPGSWNASNGSCSPLVPTPPPTVTVAPTTLQQQIQAMAGAGVNMLNFDQWNYYYNQILAGRGQPALTPAVFGQLLASQGFTEPSPAVPLTTFMQALASQGLSGIRSNRGHFRKANYVNLRGRSSNGMYVPSGNTSPTSGGF